MNNEKAEFHAKKMEMWKKKEELLNAMNENELRAFIKGYMMGQKSIFKQMDISHECGCDGHCNEELSCGCGNNDCNCKKE